MKVSHKHVKARLADAERRWLRDNELRGYTVYRHGKPAYKGQAKRAHQILQEGLFLLGVSFVIYVMMIW